MNRNPDQQKAMHQENQADLATMKARVGNVENDVHEIKTKLDRGLETLHSNLATGIAAINEKLERRAAPQWQALGVILTFCGLVGALAYWPVREGMADLRQQRKDDYVELRQSIKDNYREMVDRDRRLYDDSITRNRRMQDALTQSQRQIDRLEGSLHPIK